MKSQTVSTRIDADALVEFLRLLRDEGYNIGTQQMLSAMRLVCANEAMGNPVPSPDNLAAILAPIVCSNPRQQSEFPERLHQWLDEHQPSWEAAERNARLQLSEQHESRFVDRRTKSQRVLVWNRWFFLGGSVAVIAALSILVALFVQTDSEESRPDDNPFGEDTLALTGGAETDTAETEGAEADTAETEGAVADIANTEGVETDTAETSFNLIAEWWKSASLCLLLGFCVFVLRRRTRVLNEFEEVFVRDTLESIPRVERVAIGVSIPTSFRRDGRSGLLQAFRQRIRLPSSSLDVDRTINATVEAGGEFRPVFMSRLQTPEYVFLIERVSGRDQYARYFREFAASLCRDEIVVSAWYFQGTPKTLIPATSSGAAVTLLQLTGRYPDARVIVVSDGEGMIDSSTGEIELSLCHFKFWDNPVLMIPESDDPNETFRKQLSKLFLILPASRSGLEQLVRSIQNGRASWPMTDGSALPMPVSLRSRAAFWISRNHPGAAVAERLVESLRLYLGEDGFDWLCACAIFPESNLALTLHLGEQLQGLDGKPLSDNAAVFLRLTQLPWYRHSYFPDWFRLVLLNVQTEYVNGRVHAALELLFRNASDEPDKMTIRTVSITGSINVVDEGAVRHSGKRRKSKHSGHSRDYVFRSFMTRKPVDPLAVSFARQSEQISVRTREKKRAARFQLTLFGCLVIATVISWGLSSWDEWMPPPDLEVTAMSVPDGAEPIQNVKQEPTTNENGNELDGNNEVKVPAIEDANQPPYRDSPSGPWWHHAMGIVGTKLTGKGIRVCVVGSGIDADHPDFRGKSITRAAFISDENQLDRSPGDLNGHGTTCSRLVLSVAPECELFSAKAMAQSSRGASGLDGWILASIEWALRKGCHIIVLPLGGRPNGADFPQAYDNVARKALRQGCVIIGGAGDDSHRPHRTASVSRPQNCPAILAVAAVDSSLRVTSSSNRAVHLDGGEINLAGPNGVPRTLPDGRDGRVPGTGAAACYVAGVMALIAEETGLRGVDLYKECRNRAKRLSDPKDTGSGLARL